LTERLGRQPTPEEHSLYRHQALAHQRVLGSVLVRRVKGEFGAIEVVVALTPDNRVCGARIQRQREPAGVAAAITDRRWLGAFVGIAEHDDWRVGGSRVPAVPAAARRSAEAVAEGVRSLVVANAVASAAGPASTVHEGHS
jgi:hypothetical protein